MELFGIGPGKREEGVRPSLGDAYAIHCPAIASTSDVRECSWIVPAIDRLPSITTNRVPVVHLCLRAWDSMFQWVS